MDVYILDIGREICKNGEPFIIIKRAASNVYPNEADRIAKLIVTLLNEHAEKSAAENK
jgi:hypothetical protein